MRASTYALALAGTLLLSACTTTQQAAQPENANTAFTELANEAWEYNRMQYPGYAARNGSPEQAGQLMDMSPEALEARYQARIAFYQQLEAIDENQLSAENQINRDMIMYALKNQISEYEYNMHYTPLTNESGPHNRLSYVASGVNIRNMEDAENYLSRLRQIPTAFDQYIADMRAGMAAGITQPAVVLYGMPDSIRAYVKNDPTESTFYRPIERAESQLSAADFRNLSLEAQSVISMEVNPAYLGYHDFMVNEYIPNAREDIAATNLPNGGEFYANRIKHYTTTDLTAEEIHEIGLQEVARIRAEMEDIIAELEFEGSFQDFIDYLRSDPQFYAETELDLLKEAAYMSKRADAMLPRFFRFLPRKPYGVEAVPAEIAPTYTTGRYSGSSTDAAPGYYWVNTYALDRRPLYVLPSLTLHEAVPGHHLQIALAQELENVPDYRRSTYISAFGEGWGLYAEYLGVEGGYYLTPYEDFGRLSYEMWRAVRLVVDTGMHAMGWSRDRAVQFLASNSALSMHNVNTEIDRYISWPAQALSYKLGELTIKRLRAEAEEALGDKFDIRDFHYEVLKNGSIPLETLEAQIREYIERTLNS
ncbi:MULTISPECIES: DUF885 family protein [Gammaproteobacteria]|uniref:DUF885 domain-containing protein n=1 Tax=Gammaproteobacteria TaxID=1236 RepID=UPI000DD0DDF3|nr:MULTISPECIES: DUF885 domain-containing protein [Gammaproteobacteria]RTE86655.1 DUF885 domain-containing protein [Aliidiomarina sp. B3213]TCZ90790.1 DUF885 domain-containing protein [Lysobacter sp. N42]